MVLLGKIMILQGVGHPISWLGVCYANDPKKGGYTTPAPALDLTTSLRGDFLYQKWPNKNSIAFSSAPRRAVDSQPISPLARPAVSQTSPTETHSLGFLSVADAAPSSGETFHLRPSSGRMVMQLTRVFWVGGSNPSGVSTLPPPPPPPPPATVSRPGFEPPTKIFASAALPSDRQLCGSDRLPHCLEPSQQKLLTPPPSPPPQKSDIQF